MEPFRSCAADMTPAQIRMQSVWTRSSGCSDRCFISFVYSRKSCEYVIGPLWSFVCGILLLMYALTMDQDHLIKKSSSQGCRERASMLRCGRCMILCFSAARDTVMLYHSFCVVSMERWRQMIYRDASSDVPSISQFFSTNRATVL